MQKIDINKLIQLMIYYNLEARKKSKVCIKKLNTCLSVSLFIDLHVSIIS